MPETVLYVPYSLECGRRQREVLGFQKLGLDLRAASNGVLFQVRKEGGLVRTLQALVQAFELKI